MTKKGIKLALGCLLVVAGLSGCCSNRTGIEYTFSNDPYNPDRFSAALALDQQFPPAPLPTDCDSD